MIFYSFIVVKGNSHNLMKATAKRRRSKKQIEEEKLQSEKEAREIQKKIAAFDGMKKEMEDYEVLKARFVTQEEQLETAKHLAEHLVENGVLQRDEKGDLSLSQQQPQVSGHVDQIK